MILFPNAKINLGLDIVSRRPDGYHELETTMYPVPWCDILEIIPARNGVTTLTTSGRPVACPPEKNLVIKAYNAIAKEVDIPAVEIHLHKIIPDGAGLGGGSSDAAFTLKGLNEIFSLGYDNEHLAEIAATIGADCPFFIHNRAMLATGTGTTLTPIDLTLKGWKIVIVKPGISVPTAEAYSHVTPRVHDIDIVTTIQRPVNEWMQNLKNDFEESIFPRHPHINEIKKALISLGAVYASMSGSGSAVYGLFKESDILADVFNKTFPGHDIFIGTLG